MEISIKKVKQIAKESINKEIIVSGWIRFKRVSKNIIFLDIFDGSELDGIQVIVKKALIEEKTYEFLANSALYSPISLKGEIILNAKTEKIELNFKELLYLKKDHDDHPLGKKEHGLEFLRENAHLRAKTKLFQAIYKVRSTTYFSINNFFQENDFINVNTPIVTANDAEGAGETFNIKINDNKNFWNNVSGSLTVSGQLHAESFAQAFKNVYTFGPTFRAENSNTKRHAAEFWMLEPEMAFADYFQGMDNAEDLIKYVIKDVLNKCKKELEFLENYNSNDLIKQLNNVLNDQFERISYKEAISILQKAFKDNRKLFVETDIKFGTDLASEHERYLTEKHFKKPVFVYDYPISFKSFYMYRNPDKETVRGFDLLVYGIGELVGGSQREEDLDKILKALDEKELASENLKWYLNLRQYGYATSTGYGIGFERLVMFLTGIDNIRDVSPFPRTPGKLKF